MVMKTRKMLQTKVLIYLSLIGSVLSACTHSNGSNEGSSKVNKPDIDLQAAVMSSNVEAVKQHIAAGTDIDEKEPFFGSTPLITAATFNKPKVAKALIEAGADLSLKNNSGSTALHSAAFFGRIEIVQLLIDANADKSSKNNFGATARESIMGPFDQVKPTYEMMRQQLEPMGFKLDLNELEKARPVIAIMLQ